MEYTNGDGTEASTISTFLYKCYTKYSLGKLHWGHSIITSPRNDQILDQI